MSTDLPPAPAPLVTAATTTPAATRRPRAPVAVFRFELVANHVLVRARVNGADAWLIVDTGSGLTALDASWAAAHGARPSAEPVQVAGTGRVTTTLATVDSLALASPSGAPPSGTALSGVRLANHTVLLVPMAGVSRVHGRPVRGTVGYDVLSRYVVEVDYARRELRLHDPTAYRYTGAGVVLPVSLAYRVPVVEATVRPAGDGAAPVTARLVLDLGTAWFGAILTTPFAEAHGFRRPGAPALEAPLGTGVGGTTSGTVTRVRELRLGTPGASGLRVRNPVVGLGRDTTGFLGSTTLDGTLGAPVFARTTLVLDYPRSRVIVEPGPGFAAPYGYDASGLTLAADPAAGREADASGPVVVDHVLPGSPGEIAGVRSGDHVVAVDGRPVTAAGLDELRRLLRETGARRALTLWRAGRELHARLALRRLV